MRRYLILAAIGLCVVLGLILYATAKERAASEADKARVQAEQAAVAAEAREVAAKVDGEIKQAVAQSTERAVSRARSGERTAAKALQEIDQHAGASQPIDPALARTWVAGLKRLCDDAGADACTTAAAPNRTERQPAR